MAKEWPFSLNLLPVGGIDSPVANIEFIRGRLVNTLTIIDGVLNAPSGLPGDLKQMIFNVRYHVVVGLSLANAALRSGFSYLESASTVDGLMEAVDSHIIALGKARPVWNAWVRAAKRDQRSFSLDGDSAVPSPVRSRFMRSAAMPISTGDYVGAGLTTAGLFQFPRRSFGADGMLNLPSDIGAGLQKAVKDDPSITGGSSAPPAGSPMLVTAAVGIGIGYLLFAGKSRRR